MNDQERKDILLNAGYTWGLYKGMYFWYMGDLLVANRRDEKAALTDTYQHFLAQQAPVIETVLEDENAALRRRIAELEAENATLKANITVLEAMKVNDAAYMDALELQNTRIRDTIEVVMADMRQNLTGRALYWYTELKLALRDANEAPQAEDTEGESPSMPSPKFQVGDKVQFKVGSTYSDCVIIFNAREQDGEYEYLVQYPNGPISGYWHKEANISAATGERE